MFVNNTVITNNINLPYETNYVAEYIILEENICPSKKNRLDALTVHAAFVNPYRREISLHKNSDGWHANAENFIGIVYV